MLKIYNSLTGKKSEVKPLVPGKIGIYVCGNTVYDYCHIGHARSMIMFDVVVRYLRSQGYDVTYVRNITDIDDKIIKRAQENQEPIDALTRRFIDAQHEDEKALGILSPNYEPRATEYIPQMIELIQRLIDQGYAYTSEREDEKGDVFFNVRKFERYGKLSKNTINKLLFTDKLNKKLIEDVGLSYNNKADPVDFALWKISKPGEPHWESPWGEGRPGWHIECSAMSTTLLGQPFDIHGGGMDLKFPHHENEIAQAEAGCERNFAKFWMHVGLLNVDGAKMSKSLGNFVTIRDALIKYHPEELRFFMMNSHYSNIADFSEKNMHESKVRLSRFYDALEDQLMKQNPKIDPKIDLDCWKSFIDCMDDNFNTSVALAVLGDSIGKADLSTVKKMSSILGILQQSWEDYSQYGWSIDKKQQVKALKQARDTARAQKNWPESDRIREQLIAMEVDVEDTPQGTRVSRK